MSYDRGPWFWVLVLVAAMMARAWAGEAEPSSPEVKLSGPIFTEALAGIGYTPESFGLDEALVLGKARSRHISPLYRAMLAKPLSIPEQEQRLRKAFFDCGLRGGPLLETAAGLVHARRSGSPLAPTPEGAGKSAPSTEGALAQALTRLWTTVEGQAWGEAALKRTPLTAVVITLSETAKTA